ncbi:MAG: HD-GYP domain-containing protein [Gemmatimonadaceae bacterium]
MLRLIPFLAGAASGAALLHEHRGRRAAERFVAAALETLLGAIDANDAQTGAHVRRVAHYALILAEAADLDEREQRHVERVALFHDIGKIYAALFDIVHDDTQLTAEERRAVATHPARGAAVLEPLRAFYPRLPEAVMAHHERWDGRGYPRRLAGAQIPLAARIVAIADTFDAVTHGRRYRRERTTHHAGSIIGKGRGTQFDPELVDLFLAPPVLESISDAMGADDAAPSRPSERRTGGAEPQVPDITFRWRPEIPSPRARDRPSPEAIG